MHRLPCRVICACQDLTLPLSCPTKRKASVRAMHVALTLLPSSRSTHHTCIQHLITARHGSSPVKPQPEPHTIIRTPPTSLLRLYWISISSNLYHFICFTLSVSWICVTWEELLLRGGCALSLVGRLEAVERHLVVALHGRVAIVQPQIRHLQHTPHTITQSQHRGNGSARAHDSHKDTHARVPCKATRYRYHFNHILCLSNGLLLSVLSVCPLCPIGVRCNSTQSSLDVQPSVCPLCPVTQS